ncbi:MAG: preprotein translocase subunit SecA, partial [Planctomycetota bacterium]|nr:preprotein translocase subunit SecA [Planctomycetota bacterium]
MVKRYLRIVDQVSALEDEVSKLTDAELRAKSDVFRQRIRDGEKGRDMIPEVFAVAREAMDRAVGVRNIFNPDRNFDPSILPDRARELYEQTKAEMERTEPAEPVGEFLGADKPVPAWLFVDIPLEVYEAVRAAYPESRPPFRARPFDVQIIGAVVLYEGRIAEMKTGEGKTIVAPLAMYLAALEGKQTHVVTVNDYLVQRDRDWVFPFFRALGLTVGAIHPQHMLEETARNMGDRLHQRFPELDMQDPRSVYRAGQLLKVESYKCDAVYGTTSEFGFDYLRDNMKLSVEEQVQKRRDFAIVDEVDSILIDEARTPLIISGAAHQHTPRYEMADNLARHLVQVQKDWNQADQRVQSCMVEISSLEGDIRNARDKDKAATLRQRLEKAQQRLPQLEAERDKYTQYYEVELDKKKATLTHDGIAEAQRKANIGSFYVGENIDLPHLLEQSIRAHTVYQRDRDYVVAPEEPGGPLCIIIVDQNTGRKMIGRQWSDGLHQAVEAKEGVPIKQETQTMATITIQNFFKLYGRLAGMTGTADTEATEFYEIYGLDVVVIPTNEPCIRADYNDVVYMSVKDKWSSIVEEIKRFHDVGRPVLVGTTSVEKSDELSHELTRRFSIKHEVLNAKLEEAAREGQMIAHAGELGAVMVATNMAGRGTDIVLGKFTREELLEHWKRRGICPREVKADMDDEEIIAAVYRHIAPKELGMKKNDLASMSDEEIRLALLRKWVVDLCWVPENKARSMSESALLEELDKSGGCLLHRLRMFRNVEEMGGLHVVGTERHESRRVDNQLRGRSGRQGDQGSSRFFLSLEDDLMKMFANKATLGVLSKLGMKEGDAIEHPMLSKAVGRAQHKVEERNFLIRKNILEYDEVMDHQRHIFYAMRQNVLEGRGIRELIFEHLEDSVNDAVYTYLDQGYVPNCIAEWVREHLNVSIDPERIRRKDREDLHKLIRVDAKEEAGNVIEMTMGEYMPIELDPPEWDLKSLADWANANFKADVKVSELQQMSRSEVTRRLQDAADRTIDAADLTPLDQYITPLYGERELVKWVRNKFDAELEPEAFAGLEDLTEAVDRVMVRAREAYARREQVYPIDFAIDMTGANMQHDPQYAITQFCAWVKARYELEWSPAALPSSNPAELRRLLLEEAERWDEDRIAQRAARAVEAGASPEALDQWFRNNCAVRLTDEEKKKAADDPLEMARDKISGLLVSEFTQFERWVLLQIIDQAWKDHLYAVDQLRESIGLRSFSQRDPRIEFKREGARLFEEMQQSIRDKVTDLVFKAKLTPQVRPPQTPPAEEPARRRAGTGPDGPARRAAQPATA